jgi:hypothetical protein
MPAEPAVKSDFSPEKPRFFDGLSHWKSDAIKIGGVGQAA